MYVNKSLVLLVTLTFLTAAVPAGQRKTPPPTKVEPVTETINGTAITDPYRWLEDQKSPETRAWINAQNEYTRSLLDSFPGRARIHERLEQLTKTDVIASPFERGGKYFVRRRRADQNQFVISVRNGIDGKDEVLIDGNSLSADQTTSANILDVTQDGKLMAYGIREGGQDEVTVRVMNVETRKDLPDTLPSARYSGVSLKNDGSGIYYSRYGSEGPRVFYHAMSGAPGSDQEIFGKGYGQGTIISAGLTDDGKNLSAVVSFGSSADKTEIWVQNLKSGTPLQPIVKDVPARFSSHIAGDTMFVHTNWNAQNGKILAIDLNKPAKENW